MPFPLDLILVHPEPAACEAFRDRFAGLPRVDVVERVLDDLEPHDCFVTAGNAFGIMTAGIDAAVIEKHGVALMERVQRRILDDYLGEQPVGTCFLVETGAPDFPFVAHAPTMRMPGPVDGTDAVYRATWAALLSVYRHNGAVRQGTSDQPEIRSVAMPAMGTGFGSVSFSESARQMAAAYRQYLSPPHRLDWDEAIVCHRAVAFDGGQRVVR